MNSLYSYLDNLIMEVSWATFFKGFALEVIIRQRNLDN